MKLDKHNPGHWRDLLLLGLNTLLAILLRPFVRRGARATVVLYGHKLNGNLLPIHRELRARHATTVDSVVLTLDRAYHATLLADGERAILATSPRCAWLLATADAIITTHGLHAMQPLVRWSSIRFFDVWHGIPYKGFDADDFRVQQRYDEVWVASDLHKRLYTDLYGFDPAIVHVTGYARTDRLVTRAEDPAELRRRFGAPATGPLVLFAPTWAQDAHGRSLYPFGHDEPTFLSALSALAQRHGATILMRAHLNSGTYAGRGYTNVVTVPAGEYPDTEGILQISDVLVCDWSSIAFDFLLLDRPTLFLDVPAPFRKGFSLGPDYRFSAVIESLPQLLDELDTCLSDRPSYDRRFLNRHREIRAAVYDTKADGHATERCVQRLLAAIKH